MPKTALYGTKWHECARCGIEYPETLISQRSDDVWICVYDWDDNEEEEE